MNALLDFNQPPSEDDFCGTVLSEVAFEILSENNCDIEEKKEDVNQMIGRMFCIGCLCEDPNID